MNSNIKLIFASVLICTASYSGASQVEFCELEGKVITTPEIDEDGAWKFSILVSDAREYESPIEGIVGDSCTYNVGMKRTVYYSKKEFDLSKPIILGSLHVTRYSILDYGTGATICWELVEK